MSKIPVSVYIICQDEEKHIRRLLESIKDMDEIIVVDSGSVDKTLDIAKEYTDKIYDQKWLGFAMQKEYAKNLCSNEWVLNLDADEEVTSQLKEEIIHTINENKIDGLDIRRSGKYLGKFNHPFSKFNRSLRFFRNSKGYYPDHLVHESITVNGIIKNAKGFIYDYGTMSLEIQLRKINQYSSLRVQEKVNKHKRVSLLKLFFIFPLAFIKSFIIKRGFFNGIRGFISAINNAYYAFLKEAKLYERSVDHRDS